MAPANSTSVIVMRASALLLLVGITISLAAQDHDVPVSVDGIRCDSCGSECSMHCGSRTFRACCYNYIKKRSIPWQGPPNTVPGDNLDEEGQQDSIKAASGSVSDVKSGSSGVSSSTSPAKVGLLLKHQNGGPVSIHGIRYTPEIFTGAESIEEGDQVLHPWTLRELMAGMIRSLNAYESKKLGRALLF